MRALIQRVKSAQVKVSDRVVGEIGPGILTLLGIGREDTEQDLEWIIQKILKLRIFEDTAGKMNLSVGEIKGGHLIVSQFTLYADCTEGNRPSFGNAASPEHAKALYEKAIAMSKGMGIRTDSGVFQADMKVSLVNDGPVTLMIESPGRG